MKISVQILSIDHWPKELLNFDVIISAVDNISSIVKTSNGSTLPGNTAVASVHITRPLGSPTTRSAILGQPLVLSLPYDNLIPDKFSPNVNFGYPLICVHPCDILHSHYHTVKSKCANRGFGTVDNTASIKFFWEIASFEAENEITNFSPILDSTVFAKSDHKILDSMFIAPNVLVRCGTTTVDENGNAGDSTRSDVIRVTGESAAECPKRVDRESSIKTEYLRKHEFSTNQT